MNEIAARGNAAGWRGSDVLAWPAGAAVVVAADILFWQHEPGLSVFLFFVAIVAVVLLLTGRRAFKSRVLLAAGIAVVAALPLVETLSLTGFLSATIGASVLALAGQEKLPERLVDLPGGLVRFGLAAPLRLFADGLTTAMHVVERGLGRSVAVGLLKWLMPLVLAIVFVLLFAAANPVIEGVISALEPNAILALLDPPRIVLWGLALAFAWPFLVPKLVAWVPPPEQQGPRLPRAESVVFGRDAILRALIVFNAIFLVQTTLDVFYLWGGVRLPDGMTYADYAHRGAYSLVATALLAAVFVLLALRPNGAAEQSPLIRRLVYLFIAQNVLLVASSLLRLDLYVEVYTLTELRVAAGIWMGLVAVGLVLILARIALRKSNKWLVAMNFMSLGLTLYVCSFLDIAGFIARFNVEHSYELTGTGSKLDIGYLWSLGPSAIPALDRYLEASAGRPAGELRDVRIAREEMAIAFMQRDRDWRSWTWRDARLEAYLVEHGDLADFPVSDRTEATMP